MYTVLIVDDHEVLRYDLKRMKIWGEATGFIIKAEAENGLEALKLLRSAPFDLVITDIRMPVMDGLELLKAVSSERLNTCVVLLSDFTEYTYAREGLLHGAFDYLGKPVNHQSLTELLKRVGKFLDEKKAEKEKIRQLQGLAEEAFSPSQDIEKVVTLLCNGQNEAFEAFVNLITLVGSALNEDVGRAVIIIKNTIETIFSQVMETHGWMVHYIDPTPYKQLDILQDMGWQTFKADLVRSFREFLVYMKKFIIWKPGGGSVKTACLEVLNHIEEDISVKLIAEKLFISKAYLSELFKQSTGISLLEYITRIKVERAKYLLISTPLKNYEVADRLGFKDHEYFSKIFKKVTGITPHEFRREKPIV